MAIRELEKTIKEGPVQGKIDIVPVIECNNKQLYIF